jgi:hypothetical protein
MQDVIFTTSGDGYWSKAVKQVRITDMRLGYVNEEEDFAELCVYFDTATWDVDKDGLIYTDGDFLFEMRLFLEQHGLAGSDVDYSEAGMQGNDYVSCDVGKAFLDSWKAKFNLSTVAYTI